MPGSTTLFPAIPKDEVIKKPQHNMMGTRQPPPVAPRTTSITLQSWEQAASGGEANYGSERYARSASTDSLESSGSSSSGGGNANNRISEVGSVEFIPTRTIVKTPKLPPTNPLQFVKVQSPLYIKAEQQIKLTKEVKITREALKESEEEWQCNLDNWKSRRRKVSEKVIQRAEEMRQIEAEEQLRQEQLLQQQKKIKKFSEIVEKKSTRSYNLDLYIGQGDDSGLGGTPEPDEMLDGQSSLLRSDTSEGMTSESESVDSDIHKSEKIVEKEPPKVPQKPYSRLKKSHSISYDDDQRHPDELFQHFSDLSKKELVISENSSAEPSDVEGHTADTEATSSEEDVTFSGQTGNTDSGLDSLGDCRRGDLADSASDLSQDGSLGPEKSSEKLHLDLTSDELEEEKKAIEEFNSQVNKGHTQSIRLTIKPGDNKGFGFTLKGGKDQSSSAYIENVVKGGAADEMGLKDGDKIISLNGELSADYSHASLIFSIKQAVYTGILDLIVNRSDSFGIPNPEIKPRESRKGKSFAEKLAIFSAGINAPTGLDEPKSSAKLLDTKRESLVLRRRSAFENGKTDSVNTLNRRASCISHPPNAHPEKILEKRHSVDFIVPQNLVNENSLSKKGPPPPVPVKPKIKTKPTFFDVNKPITKTNGSIENSLSSPGNKLNGTENHYSKSQSDHENLDTLEDSYRQEDLSPTSENQDISFEINTENSEDNFVSEETNCLLQNNEDFENNISADISYSSNGGSPKEEFSKSNCSTNFDAVGDIITDNIFTSFEANEPVEQNGEILEENDAFLEATEEARYSFFDRTVEFSPDSEDKLYEDQFEPESEAGTSEEVCVENVISGETSLSNYAESSSEQTAEVPNDIDSACLLETDTVRETEINSVSSACNLECDNEDNFDKTDDTECNDFQETNELDDLEGRNSNQSNTSPLCLSLEKIDEDDVISASTTTSSETPDTETVIETLPSNLSPLPNDESNGEDSSKLLNCQDEESDHPVDSSQANEMSSNEKYSENVTVVNYENESVVNYSENGGILNYGDNENDYNYDENEAELNYDENEPELNYDDNDIPLSYDEIEAELNSGDNQIAQRYEENDTVQNYGENETAQNYEENGINCDEVETAQSYCNIESAHNFVDKDLEINDKIPASEDDLTEPYKTSSNETNSILDKTFYGDPQDDEYAQELEESLDQITSLDIIDRIEQSLMDQLQKEDPFEDMSTNLNSQFESDIDNPWLYYPEDAEYLEDLTPRKLEPPKEPPPPPPPPEAEDNDNTATSLTRTNSTKRLKRELWRRRSDFLGLESSESIDVEREQTQWLEKRLSLAEPEIDISSYSTESACLDSGNYSNNNIPPPPPGLEELLKQEREQTQWLEKRLSLAEPEIDISSYSTESACLDSGNYSNNDYSDYIIDDNAENSKESIDTEQEQWKENMEDESLYETNYGVQYETAAEPLSTVIEEPIKLAESPQHKAKQNLHSLGAAPKAKIMDSTKWITEKVTAVSKKPIEPVFRQASYNQNYWLAQDGERRRNMQYSDSQVDRRYSMPPVYSNTHPDVTVRTWGDREYEYQQHRPRSAIYDRTAMAGNVYDQYMNMDKKDLQRTQSLDSRRDLDYETDLLEPEVHNCSCCGKGLCEGSAMGIEALRLYFHIECFRCCSCHMQLGNGSCGTDVQVKNNQLYCPACFTVD